ncbi:MAG: hypothetical protein RLZZ524_293, partial [Pseudomonadota bacterium]
HIARELRRLSSVPILMLTGRAGIHERILGLEAGADDYLVKPFDLDELLARVEAVRRRSTPSPRLKVRDNEIDLEHRTVLRGGVVLDLTALEWAILRCLANRPGRIHSRTEIESEISAGGLHSGDSNTLEVIISRLRKKMGTETISTHRGLGYRLDV